MQIADVLRGKAMGPDVMTTAPSATVGELLALLSAHNVGALHERGRDLLDATVADIMTADVVVCSPQDRAADLARVMTERRIRHLPVCNERGLVGIVSIGDLVKTRIDELEREREHLASYINS
jgi:CBS domain-containing protein